MDEDVLEVNLIRFEVPLDGFKLSTNDHWPHAPAVLSVAVKLIVEADAPRVLF
jgi:hypothetical protein